MYFVSGNLSVVRTVLNVKVYVWIYDPTSLKTWILGSIIGKEGKLLADLKLNIYISYKSITVSNGLVVHLKLLALFLFAYFRCGLQKLGMEFTTLVWQQWDL